MSDLNMMFDAMSELVAMSKTTSGVRDGGRKRREGDHQYLDPISHALDDVDGASFVYHEEVHFCGR